MRRLLDLQDQGVLVTGAAGGIGAAVSRRLVRLGARPVLLDLPGERLDAIAVELGPRAVVAPADVRDRNQVIAAVDGACELTDGLVGAVIGAGIVRPDTLIAQTESDARAVIDVNLYGSLWSFQAAMPHIDRRGGHALALCSIAAIAPIPLSGVYPITKAAMANLVAAVRTEAMNRPTSAGVVYLSAVDTPMNERVRRDSRAARASQRSLSFLTRPISAEDVAERIVTGLQRRRRVISAPAWQAPATWPQTVIDLASEWVLGRTGLRDEVPGGRFAAEGRISRAAPVASPAEAEGRISA